MGEFIQYQHVERWGTIETEDIEFGECFIFPKIDGTNASVWSDDGVIQAGSRRRHLNEDQKDNFGFRAWVQNSDAVKSYLEEFPDHHIYGEWLVPHSLKTYRVDAWRQFYVFDITREDGIYIPYPEYKESLDRHGLEYIPPLMMIKNPSVERLNELLESNDYLIETGKGAGEGIVIKNYQFRNRYGRVTWAKMVRSEFKEKPRKHHGAQATIEKDSVEERIALLYVTQALVDKVHAKVTGEDGWSSRKIPQLLNTVFYDVVKEESWNYVKKFKNPTVNYKRLLSYCNQRIKELKPEIF